MPHVPHEKTSKQASFGLCINRYIDRETEENGLINDSKANLYLSEGAAWRFGTKQGLLNAGIREIYKADNQRPLNKRGLQ